MVSHCHVYNPGEIHRLDSVTLSRLQPVEIHRLDSGQSFRIFEIIIFCFVVATCDLVHALDAMYSLP